MGYENPSPRAVRGRVFYGWYVLAACVLIELFGLGFGVFAVATVYPYIVEAFPEWSRRTIFLPTSIIIFTVGAMSPIIGPLIDRIPIRRVFVVGIIVQSLALYAFSAVQTPAQYLGVSFLIGLGMSGVTILPNQVLVSRWFHERVGLVNGILLAATALGAAIAPALITRIIEGSDWRHAFVWMAVLAFVGPMLAVVLVIRDRPESIGLSAAGAVASSAPSFASASNGATLAQAAATPFFWLLAAAILFGGMPCYSYNKHILVHLQELGYAKIAAADYKSFFFLVAACSRISFGWLCDRFDKGRMMLGHFVLIAAGYPILLLVRAHPELLMPCLFIVGVGYGGLLPSMPIMAVDQYGRTHLGKILGVYKIAYDLAAAGAPLFTAELFDRYHTYDVPDVWNTGFAWIGVGFAAISLRYRRQGGWGSSRG